MLRLYDELRSENMSVFGIISNAGLKIVNFTSLTEADAHYPHVAGMRSTLSCVGHWAHALIGETAADKYSVGQELFGYESFRCRGD